ncbi:hypothetical protein M601_002285 [Cellulophaga baltica 4]|nr:hypothetical protein M601_002285 [Cellulophaga baltica 4]
MNNYIKIIATLLLSNITFAQYSVTGKITDNEGEPIFGATISYAKKIHLKWVAPSLKMTEPLVLN